MNQFIEIKKHDIRSVHNSGNGSTKPTDTLAKVYGKLYHELNYSDHK